MIIMRRLESASGDVTHPSFKFLRMTFKKSFLVICESILHRPGLQLVAVPRANYSIYLGRRVSRTNQKSSKKKERGVPLQAAPSKFTNMSLYFQRIVPWVVVLIRKKLSTLSYHLSFEEYCKYINGRKVSYVVDGYKCLTS